MAWARNGTPYTEAVGADDLEITDLTAKKFNQCMCYTILDGSLTVQSLRFNNNSNTVYSRRRCINGGTDAITTSADHIGLGALTVYSNEFSISYVISISGEEKLLIAHVIESNTTGATYIPSRNEVVGKFVPSPDADITRVDMVNINGGGYEIGSNLSALGGDETETVTLQDGTIFEETDTNKAYIWSSSSKTWTQL